MICPFCNRNGILINSYWKLIKDSFPVSEDHHLLIPTEHLCSIRNLNSNQWNSLAEAFKFTITLLTNKGMNDFNIGLNNGINSGQTINHLHFHFIPRIFEDTPNPRGGVRNVIPLKKDYP